MSIELMLYMIDLMFHLRSFCAIVIIVFIAFLIMIGPFLLEKENREKGLKLIRTKTVIILGIMNVILLVIIPSKETMYMIIATHYLKESNIPVKVEKLIEQKLDEYVDKKGE